MPRSSIRSCEQVPVWLPQDALSRSARQHLPIAGDVRAVELVDCAQTDFAGAAGMSALQHGRRPENRRQDAQREGKSAANSAQVSACEYSRINSRCGGDYADHP